MVIEANHDERMLEAGRYPFRLKRRILGDKGHISNENSGRLITELWNEEVKQIFLGHLSDENNMPELALETVRCELLMEHKDFEAYTKLYMGEFPRRRSYEKSGNYSSRKGQCGKAG